MVFPTPLFTLQTAMASIAPAVPRSGARASSQTSYGYKGINYC